MLVAGALPGGAAGAPAKKAKILFDRLITPGGDDYEVFTMNLNGSHRRNLSKDPHDDWGASASRDGRRIVFTSKRDPDHNNEIFIMRSDGSNLHQLTHTGASVVNEYPSFSPNGKRVVFDSSRGGGVGHIYLMQRDGSNQHRLAESPLSDYAAVFSPNGRKIAFSRYFAGKDHVYEMNARGGHVHAITNENGDPVLGDTPQFFPSGAKIAFESNRHEGDYDVFTMDANGSKQRNLTHNSVGDGEPSVSPSGKRIVFTSARSGANSHLFKMRANGTHPRPLTSGDFFEEYPHYVRLRLP
jgi:TolB protein